MIKSLEMDKFKVYRTPQKVELAPLTLIVGVNNSGKSTLFDSLLMLSTATESEQSGPLNLNGSLPGKRRPEGTGERVRRIEATLEEGTTLGVRIDQEGLPGVLRYTHKGEEGDWFHELERPPAPPLPDSQPWLNKPIPRWMLLMDALLWFDIIADPEGDVEFYHLPSKGREMFDWMTSGSHTSEDNDYYPVGLPELLRLHPEDEGLLVIKLWKNEEVYGISHILREPPILLDPFDFPSAVEQMVFDAATETMKFWFSLDDHPSVHKIEARSGDKGLREERLKVVVALAAMMGDEDRNTLLPDPILLEEITQVISLETFMEIKKDGRWMGNYFAEPIPERSEQMKPEQWFHKLTRVKLFSGSNPAFKDQMLHKDQILDSGELKARIQDMLSRFMPGAEVSIAEPDEKNLTELRVRPRNGKEHNLADLGLGLRRLVALTKEAAVSGSIVLVEEPEAHLHQGAQAELGDFFIRQLRDVEESQWLIETHSPHLLYRVLRRIRETGLGTLEDDDLALKNTEVRVLCVEPVDEAFGEKGSGSFVRELMVGPNGELLDPLPPDFFESTLSDRHLGWPES